MKLRAYVVDSHTNDRIFGTIIEIDDIFISYSPMLSGMRDSVCTPEKFEDAYLLECEDRCLIEYVKFLLGEDFSLDPDLPESTESRPNEVQSAFLRVIQSSIAPENPQPIATFFDFMGHTNRLKLPLSVWKMKLHDNWVRDNFYRLELWKDPYFDLVEIPIVNQLPGKVKEYLRRVPGWYIAGGAALWMAGYTGKYSDIDLFTCMSKDEANLTFNFLNNEYHQDRPSLITNLTITGNSVSTRISCVYKIQHILRTYTCPSETVHGFDLDCVGIVYIDGKLYTTKRTLFSLSKKMNWFDSARASPSYAYRLTKYKARGFDIFLPLFDKKKLHPYNGRQAIRDMKSGIEYDSHRSYTPGKCTVSKLFKAHGTNGVVTLNFSQMVEFMQQVPTSPSSGEKIAYSNPETNERMVYTPVDVLILAQYYDFYVNSHFQTSDYEYAGRHMEGIRFSKRRHDGPSEAKKWQYVQDGEEVDFPLEEGMFIIRTEKLRWREQDPMTQVSSTCYPTPIDDLEQWYNTSSFYGRRTKQWNPKREPIRIPRVETQPETVPEQKPSHTYDIASLARTLGEEPPKIPPQNSFNHVASGIFLSAEEIDSIGDLD